MRVERQFNGIKPLGFRVYMYTYTLYFTLFFNIRVSTIIQLKLVFVWTDFSIFFFFEWSTKPEVVVHVVLLVIDYCECGWVIDMVMKDYIIICHAKIELRKYMINYWIDNN